MGKPIITIEGLGKRYRIAGPQTSYYTLRDSLASRAAGLWRKLKGGGAGGANAEDFWALKDVSFSVQPGEVVGIIGRNGAGKSTLLKILSGITEPTVGRATMYGRIGSLLEVGTGFHPELTGRENIYLSGAILGMTRAEIARKFDEIVAFSGVEKFLDTPCKHYSSGMYVRLGFAVAAYLEPEILMVDEVLAVGDAEFQKKCLGKMGDVAKSGRTILFVSHNMAAVSALCSRGILLDGGIVTCDTSAATCVEKYTQTIMRTVPQADLAKSPRTGGSGPLRFSCFRILRADGQTSAVARTGEKTTFALDYVSEKSLDGEAVMAAICVSQFTGEDLFFCQNTVVGAKLGKLPPKGTLECTLLRLPLRGGKYPVTLFCEVNGVISDWISFAAELNVEEDDFYGTGRMPPPGRSPVLVDMSWRLKAPAAADG